MDYKVGDAIICLIPKWVYKTNRIDQSFGYVKGTIRELHKYDVGVWVTDPRKPEEMLGVAYSRIVGPYTALGAVLYEIDLHIQDPQPKIIE